MVGNLSVNQLYSLHYVNSQRDSQSRVNYRDGNSTDKQKQASQFKVGSRGQSAGNAKQNPFEISDDYLRNSKNVIDNIRQSLDRRTVVFKMMETMGATGTSDSMSGLFLDTYV